MASNLFLPPDPVELLVATSLTYVLHSTILLVSIWALFRCLRTETSISHWLPERLWKIGALAGFLTTAAQFGLGLGVPISTDWISQQDVTNETLVSVELIPSTREREPKTTADVDTKSQQPSVQVGESADLPFEFAEAEIWELAELERQQALAEQLVLETAEREISIDSAGAIQDNNDIKSVSVTIDERPKRDNTARSMIFTWCGWTLLGWWGFAVSYLVLQSICFRWQMRNANEASKSHVELLASVCRSSGIHRRVRLLRSTQFEEPVAYGVFRWTILIPSHIDKRLNRAELAALLTHELAHLQRGDIYWLMIGRLLTTCFLFQPWNLLARKRWQQHAEFLCDDWAIERQSVDRITLARSLTLVAEWRTGNKLVVGVVSAGGPHSHVTDRVERLLQDRSGPDAWTTRGRRLVTSLVAMLMIGFIVLWGPQFGNAVTPQALPEINESESDADNLDIVDTESVSKITPTDELKEEWKLLHTDIDALTEDLKMTEAALAEMEKSPERSSDLARLRRQVAELQEFIRTATFSKNRQWQDSNSYRGGTK